MHISVIDDEINLADKILKKLKNNGYAADAFYGYEDFMKKGNAESGLYIIDVTLWDGTGFDIIKWLRKEKKSVAPIIIISGHGDTQNVVYGLNIGADDYLTKPIMPEELLARVRAMLRRHTPFKDEPVMKYKTIVFNPLTKEVTVWKRSIDITKTERLLLDIFLMNRNKVIPREKIIANVWWVHKLDTITNNTMNVTIFNLRKKLGRSFSPRPLYKQGYILD